MTASITRRQALAAGAFWLAAPRLALAEAATERRFVFILQRGAADGLSIVVPEGDPALAGLRGGLAVDTAATRLDGFFGLHPSLAEWHRLYTQGEALFVHAVASPYRDRSHFDGQNVLETGGHAPHELRDGWLNRLVGLLPRARGEAVALAPTVPMALRGAAPVVSYAPSALPQAREDLAARVAHLYEDDPQLHALWSAAMQARGMASGMERARQQDPATLGRLAAGFLARPQGPRIAMIETGGWDTHSAQLPRLAGTLRSLDALLLALREGLAAAWSQTVVLVATEFGRTAAANGTGGTDHGTGAAAMLAGGAVQGGRVIADWPGLAPGALHEGRDLRPTLGLDAFIAALAAESFELDPARAAKVLFPRLGGRPALPRLLRA
ncbi:DUF1501 domain-containing protein [Ramlibacter sp. MAHUQ-53]|uniref:DUF1501 domain-containing protein n=1 Tax=unclassified Ramlibacter TaxID=2617605 RepID=UPI00363A99C3